MINSKRNSPISAPYFNFIFISGLLVSSIFAFPDSALKFESFSKIMVLDKGRPKPLDSYARLLLLQISGKRSYNKKPAVDWIAKLFFEPEKTRSDAIFLVNEPRVLEAMGLADLKNSKRFSYSQIKPGLEKLRKLVMKISNIPEKNRDHVQREMMRLFHNVNQYVNLASSFQFAIPAGEFSVYDTALAAVLGMQPAPAKQSFLDMIKQAGRLHQFLGAYTSDSASSGPLQKEVLRLTRTMYQWSQYYKDMPIHILPKHGEDQKWLSSWDVLSQFSSNKGYLPHLGHLGTMVKGYLAGDNRQFSLSAEAFNQLALSTFSVPGIAKIRDTEILYNRISPFTWGRILYLAGLLFGLAAMAGFRKWLVRIALMFLLGGFVIHSTGIVWRMMITSRPPVTNLYETFVFTGWICVLLGLAVEVFRKNGIGILTSALTGLALLLIAGRYSLDGDTMGMLVAVLDSNFWLTVHVITITMGYAGCCAAGALGHIYMVQALTPKFRNKAKDTAKAIYGIFAFGMLFTFIGTVTGGIWADQSWGRFWGWDPKENGALLILLWTAIIFHGRLGGYIKDLGFAAGSIFCIIVVMFAWFGVNLLGVGLHSYGFSSGIFLNLVFFTAFELLFLVFSVLWVYSKRPKLKAG